MSSRDRTAKKQSTPQQSTTLPAARSFVDKATSAETTIAPKRASTAPFSFSDVSVVDTASGSPVQTKLSIGEPGDKYEQEADSVARQVVQQINSPQAAQRDEDIQRATDSSLIQAKSAGGPAKDKYEEEADKMAKRKIDPSVSIMRLPLQRQSSIPVGPASNEFEQGLNRARSGGSSMDPKVQTKMESAMSADFSRVKVHTDAHADQLSRSIQAKAFTTGNDVFFKQGAYAPNSRSGQELLAHELTHVVQQNQSTVSRKADAVHTSGCGCSNCTGKRIQRTFDTAIRRSVDSLNQPQLSPIGEGSEQIQRAVHESATTTGIRMSLPDDFLGGDDALYNLATKVHDVMNVPNTINITSDRATFEREYAKYLSIREVGDESKATDEKVLNDAKKAIDDAGCRAFTNQKSQTWYYGDQPALSDGIHEMVHILSAQGGETPILKDYGAGLNEGFTHLFTTKMCDDLGIAVNPAYAEPTAFAKKLDNTYGTSAMYKAYFKGGMDGLIDLMDAKYNSYLQSGKLSNGKNVPYSERTSPPDQPTRIDTIKTKLKSWQSDGRAWLDLRIL